MFKKIFATALTVLLLVASIGYAANMQVNSSAVPVSGGTITPNGIKFYNGVDATYTVAPKSGWTLTNVVIDGVVATAPYTVPFDTSKIHTVKANFAQTEALFSISIPSNTLVGGVPVATPGGTLIITGGGATSIPPYKVTTPLNTLSNRYVVISPNTGYQIASITVDGVTNSGTAALPADRTKATGISFVPVAANHVVSATFTKLASATVYAGGNKTAAAFTNLSGSAVSSVSPIVYQWTQVSGPGTSVFSAPTANKTRFTASAIGNYLVTLTANGITSAPATITIVSAGAIDPGSNPCINCHAGSAPVIAYPTSTHAINAITCSNCHNPNSTLSHPYDALTALPSVCINCHVPQVNSWVQSPHNKANNGFEQGGCATCHNAHSPTANPSVCINCHVTTLNGPQAQVGNWVKSSHNIPKYGSAQVGCAACHNTHSTVAIYGAGTANGCQTCHAPGKSYSIYSSNLVGKAPHFQTGTADANGFYATASFIQPTSSVSANCADCHGHNNTINAGWADGGHGSVTAVPWKSDASHVWLDQGPATAGINFQNSPQQTNCIRCHTAQGFAQFVDSGFTKIDRIKNAGASIKDSSPLTCNACHTSPEGPLRGSFGAGYKAFWGYSTPLISGKKVVTSIQLGDNKNSNICMPCHSQRASGQEIKDVFATGSFKQYSAGSNIYPHAAQPAAIFYGKGGYEFTATNGTGTSNGFGYQDRARHQRIGNNGTGTGYNNTGVTQGSCVACHMASDKTHSLEITAASFTNTCSKCHPSNFVQADVDSAKANFDAAVKALGNLLVAKGITKDGINPLPERTAKDMSLGTKDNVIAQRNMGAWFNWYLFSIADKGAYAHNPSYARRLITDSIDALDDGVLNNSAAATILAQQVAGKLTVDEKDKAVGFSQEPGCMGCHFGSATNNLGGEAIPGIEKAPHFNITGALVPGQTFTQAQFIVPGAQCNNCHGYGHGTDSPSYSASKVAYPNLSAVQGKGLLKNYAESAHGEINGMAWTDYNFLNLASRNTCTPCHTTNGFVNAVNSANANGGKIATPAFIGNAADTTKQVLACNACHSSTAWKTSVRTISGGYVAGMGGFGLAQPAYITYPDVGESNVCTPCHASRENGASINASAADFANTSFKNPHYLAASAVFYGKGGFQFYSSGVRYNTYGAAGKVGRNANWSHGKLGMDNYTTAALSTGAVIGTSKDNTGHVRGSGNQGQCIACHMGPTNTHTFGAFETAKATWGSASAQTTKGCYGCHQGEDMEEVAVGEKANVDRALDFLAHTLEAYGLFFNNDANPYFFTSSAYTTSATNWATDPNAVSATGKMTMGAAMNLKLLKAEKGSHVHNRTFMRALITDSVVYLQKGPAGIAADRNIKDANVNNIINFTNYSTTISAPNSDRIAAGQSGSSVSVSTLKGYLTRLSGGLYNRR